LQGLASLVTGGTDNSDKGTRTEYLARNRSFFKSQIPSFLPIPLAPIVLASVNPNQIEPNQIKSNQTKSEIKQSQVERVKKRKRLDHLHLHLHPIGWIFIIRASTI
jgi:hypothetical protein